EAAAGHAPTHGSGAEASEAHAPRHDDAFVARALNWPVAALTVLSAVGGLLLIAGVWSPFGDWVAQVAEPLVEPSVAQEWAISAVAVAVGLAGAWLAWAIYRTGRLAVPALPAAQRLLERKLYFDELYDAIAYRPAALLAARLRSDVETPFVEGALDEIGRLGRDSGGGVARLQSGLLRSYALAIAVSALVLWVVPMPREWAGGLAFVTAFAEVGLWVGGAARFDYGGGLQFEARRAWFSDLGVSYHVGFFGFSLWLAGLTVVVCALAIAYGVWAERERSRAYFGLMLFLTGSIVGVFAAQDLLLFSAFFEGMLIPLYVLVGVWGGPRRATATLLFV